MEIETKQKNRILRSFWILLIILCVYFGVLTAKSMDNGPKDVQNTITVTGHGEVTAVPDLATIYFTVESSKDTQKAAGEEVNGKVKNILAFLKDNDIADKDIKTDAYNSYPKYSQQRPCPVYYGAPVDVAPCEVGESKIIGYTVSQSITVKIRKIDDSLSTVIDGINKFGVTNMNGPSMTIDKQDDLKVEARKKAIDEAKKKAKVLAKDLGVRLGDVTSFSENGGGYPMYFAKSEVMMDSAAGSAPTPELPKGENTISSDITIVYEIK